MEKTTKIEPHKITKPIQLLAAWLTGLVLVNGAFLIAASKIQNPKWVAGALVIAAIINVPLFLLSIFLLQTKFRPEMQEDSFYSKYLENKTGKTDRQVSPEFIGSIREDLSKIEYIIREKKLLANEDETIFQERVWGDVVVSVNKSLPYFTKLLEIFKDNDIPVHELFGGGRTLEAPKEFKIAIGSGFSVSQIKKIVRAASSLKDGWVSFAYDDDEVNQYNNVALIGAWGGYQHGVQFSAFSSLVDRQDITDDEVYKILGK